MSKEMKQCITLASMSELITEICEEYTKKKDQNPFLLIKPFLSKKPPQISIKYYLERLKKYSKIEDSTLVLILIYIDRICNLHNIALNYFNIHKLLLGAMMIAIRYNEDFFYTDEYYAKVGGVTIKELKRIEYEFLSLSKFQLFVSQEDFNKYNQYLSIPHINEEEEWLSTDDEKRSIGISETNDTVEE